MQHNALRLVLAMSERLIRSSADWPSVFRARAAELGWAHREVDYRAKLPDGYFSKILAGMKNPTTVTIGRICGALALQLRPEVDIEREAIVKAEGP